MTDLTHQPACRNVEQKFRSADLDAALTAGLAAGAKVAESMRQRDVYFNASAGRLKLRVVSSDVRGDHAELIAYERPDAHAERVCAYHLVPVDHAEEIESVLTIALGRRAVVCKRRRLLMSGSVRLHFDEVAGLGEFVEFEAVLGPAVAEQEGRRQVTFWRERLGLTDAVARSYVDLVEANAPSAAVDSSKLRR